jgi:hypothetical protein
MVLTNEIMIIERIGHISPVQIGQNNCGILAGDLIGEPLLTVSTVERHDRFVPYAHSELVTIVHQIEKLGLLKFYVILLMVLSANDTIPYRSNIYVALSVQNIEL